MLATNRRRGFRPFIIFTTLLFVSTLSYAQNNALDFDGSDDYINVSAPYTSFSGEITVEAWINLNTLTSDEGVMGQSSADTDNSNTNVWLLGNVGTSDGSLTFSVWDGTTVRSATSTTDFRGTGWHHIAGVADATSTRIYVDGVLEASGTAVSTGIQSNGSAIIHIGKDSRYAASRFADGLIDEVRIWSDARTELEIQTHKTKALTGSESNLVTYYNLNEGTAASDNSGISAPEVQNQTSANIDGTLTNFAKTGSASNWVDGSGNKVGTTFITTWQTTSASETVQLPTGTGTYSYNIDWGDGTVESLAVGNPSHTYTTAGTYAIAIDGTFPHLQINNNATYKDKILTIEQWGTIAWTSMSDAFYGASQLTYQATDNPDLSSVSTLHSMFQSCTLFNGDIGSWDLTNVNSLNAMFWSASTFNQDLSNWDVSNVTDMQLLFFDANAYNNGGNALSWDSKTSQVLTMRAMFGQTVFNHDLSAWDLSSVTTISNMFRDNTVFNQDLSAWDVSKVEDFSLAFSGATAFNQNLGSWDISSATNFSVILFNSAMSTANYDLSLEGWATLDAGEAQVPSDVPFTFANLTYCAVDARNTLTTTYNWDISGDTQATGCIEINVQGNSIDIADGDNTPASADSTNLGSVMGGQIVNYTIQSVGNGSISISSIDVSGTHADEFTVSGLTTPATITTGSSATFQVTFIPTASGNRTATITINSDDADEAAYDFAVQATVSGTKSILINEVVTEPQQDWSSGNFFNPSPGGTAGSDDEWVELYINEDNLNLNDYTIELIDTTPVTGDLTASGGAFTVSNYISLTGGTFSKTKSGDYLVLGDVVGAINNTSLTIRIKNGSSIIDQVVLSGGGSNDAPSGNSSTTDDEAIARIPNATDTYDNSADFVLTRATLGASTSASGTVVINEVVTDPFSDWSTSSFDGTIGASTVSEVDEWIELYIGTSGINLTGWTMDITDTSPESGSIASGGLFATVNYVSSNGGTFINTVAGDYLVLGNPSGGINNTNLTIVLKDASGTTIDQVTIGGGAGEAPSGSNSAFEAEAIARYPNASDTGTDDADFIQTRPSLGSDNSPTGTVLINEIVTDPQQDWDTNDFNGTIAGGSVSGSDEWIELYIGTAGLNLTGWTMTIDDGTTPDVDNSILTTAGSFGDAQYFSTSGGTFTNTQAGDYYVLGNASGSMNNDVVITLKDASGNVVDEVELGDDEAGDGAGDGAPDGSANGGDASGIADEAIARIPNGTDTDNDVNDFAAVPASLGTANNIAQLAGVGNGLAFDGTNDYVEIPDAASLDFDINDDFTVETWVKVPSATQVDNSGTRNDIISKWDGTSNPFPYNIRYKNDDNRILAARYDGSNAPNVTSTSTFNDDLWHHVAFVKNGSTLSLYVDGVLEATNTDNTSGTTVNASPLTIGARTTTNQRFTGETDEIRIWSDARTQEEILENMMGLLDPSATNLQAYYRFDQSSGSSLPDLTANNNDGTLNNMDDADWTAASWDIFAENVTILQSGGVDVSTATSGELTLTDVSFLNDDNDLLLAGHDNGNFSEVTTDLPSGTLVTARYDRIWHLTKNDAASTSNGSVKLGFDLGATPEVTYNYYLLERTGSSGDFAIVPALGINPNGNSIEITVDASAIDDGSYYTVGRSDGGIGNALAFDGSDDHITVPHTSSLNLNSADFTIEGWVYPKLANAGIFVLKGRGGLVSEAEDYGISISSSQYFLSLGKASSFSETKTANSTLTLNAWNHIAVVYNSSTMTVTFYLNGIADGTGTYSGTLFTTDDNDLYIGRQGSGGGGHFNGNMDEIRIWTDQRTQQEILDNMFTNLTGDETNLLAYYRFNEGIGDGNTSMPDLTGNAFGGTLTNFNNLGSATTSSNYITSDRSAITSSTTIINGGDLTATDGELTLTSTQTAGDFLQDANDYLRWNNDGGDFTETTSDVPSSTQVTTRYTRIWQIEKNDAVGTAHGNVTFAFDLGTTPDPDYSYFLLTRSGTSGDFSIVEARTSSPSGNTISFVVDAAEITSDYYFTLGRTDAGAGNTIYFDANDDYIDIADNDAFTFGNGTTDAPFSIETWVRIDNTAEFSMISKKSGGLAAGEWYMGSSTGGQYLVTLWDESTGGSISQQTAAGLFSAGEWYHLAFTYDGSGAATGLTLYVDGIPSNDATGGAGSYTAMENTTSSVQMGVVANTFSNLDGALDEIRIWSDVRTEQEIKDNINRKLDVANESDLVAYYQFNTGIAEGTNTGVDLLTDRSGNGHSGTLTNFALSSTTSNWVASTAVVADQTLVTSLQGAGNALDFDGADEFVSISDDASLESSSTLTVEAWVRPDVTTSFRGIAARYFTSGDASNVFALQINSGNYDFLINESDNNLISASATATASTWTHVAGVADGTNVNIYIDGILMASTAYDGTITSNSSRDLFIGKYRTEDLFGPYDGLIDELRIWNTARTADEIQTNMFESLTGNETGLVAYYTFDESSGTTLDDNSANANTGTLNNMEDADWVDASGREPFKTNGPGNLNSGSTWVGGATPGASQTLYVQHDLTVDTDLTVDDFNLTSGNTLTLGSGQTLTVTGNLVNNGTITGDGKIQFTAGNPMISGGTFSNLEMNGGSPILCGETTMTGTLTLTSGNLQLDNYNLIFNSGAGISGGSSSSYIQTINQSSSGGSVQLEISSSDGQVTYPIGTSTNYTPIFFNNFGTTASFAIRTFDGIYAFNTTGAAFTSNVISKTWDVNATGSGFNVSLSIQWNTADETAGFDRTAMYISTNDGSGWVERAGPVSATEISSGVYQASASGITSFSGVGSGGEVITPVTLLDFYAVEGDDDVELVWHTATEIDNEKFIIERSADGIDFLAIDEVAGNGDSQALLEYRYVDTDPMEGINYYRLKQVDYDGDFEYSPIVMAETELKTHELVVYPNPFSDRLYIGLPQANEPAEVKLTSITGQVVFHQTMVSDNRFVQLDDLNTPPGLYILEIQQADAIVRMRLINE